MVKIITYNTLYYNFSDGSISYVDQLRNVMSLITKETPDIACLLEMPNYHQEVKSETLLLCEQLEKLMSWFYKQGYPYVKCLNNTLSIWIVSKLPLCPLLLLGSSTVSGAMNKLLSNPQFGPQVQITQSSNYVDCFKAACCIKDDRSIITGVIIGTSILPLIVVHDKCLFWNSRYSNLRLHFLSAAVSGYGLVVGDFNGNLDTWNKDNLVTDSRLDSEIPTIANTLRSWTQGVGHLPRDKTGEPIPTAVSNKFPYESLYIDGAFCNQRAKISVVRSDIIGVSDHMPIIIEFDAAIALANVCDSKKTCLMWFQSQDKLADTYNKHFEIPCGNTYSYVSPQSPSISPVIIEAGVPSMPEPMVMMHNKLPPPARLRGEALPVPTEVMSPGNIDTSISEAKLKEAAAYIRDKFPPGSKICHSALAGTKERTSTNSMGLVSCHFRCNFMHEAAIKDDPVLSQLIGKDNTYESGNLWRGLCAYANCNGFHSSKIGPSSQT